MRAGLHLIIPLLEHEVRYPIYWQTYTMSSKVDEGEKLGDDSIRARTRDGQEVHLDTSVIFRVDQGQAVSIHIDWQNRYIEDFIRPLIRGEVRTQVSQFTVEEVNSSARKDLEATLEELLNAEFAEQGLLLSKFLVRDITFSTAYAEAIENKQVALEGEEQTIHEAQQLRNIAAGRRDQLRIEAQGEADAILLQAQAQADGLKLIADALAEDENLITYHYVDKIAPNVRVMLLPSGNPLILPLPNLDEMIPLSNTVAPTTTVTPTPIVGVQP
jgi:regulator of protease activity HflC (stomatin/prohibitin superfamily)